MTQIKGQEDFMLKICRSRCTRQSTSAVWGLVTRPVTRGRSGSPGGGLRGASADCRPLARHRLEAGLDAGDGAAGAALLTLQEVETRVLLQDGIRGATRVTRHVLLCKTQDTS